MTAQIRVARASREELDLIFGLLEAQFEDHGIDTMGPALREAVAAIFEHEGLGFFLLAWEGDDVAGMAAVSFAWTLEHGGKSAWLDELYVVPEYRDRGIGTALLRAAASEARGLGCAAIDLEVDRGHKRAERLYEREGFRPLPRSRWVLPLT